MSPDLLEGLILSVVSIASFADGFLLNIYSPGFELMSLYL